MIDEGKIYTYPELCEIRNEKRKSGKAKQLQLQEWSRFFKWENITTQKFLITKVFDVPIEKIDNRKNNGAKALFPEEMFDYLLKCLIRSGNERNTYFQRGMIGRVYVANSLIYKEFGFDMYAAFGEIQWNNKDEDVKELFQDICLNAVKSNSVGRICKKLGYKKNSLPKGILRQEGKRGKAATRLIPDDDLLPKYNEYMQQALETNECKTEIDAIKKGIYLDILQSIEEKFAEEKLFGVKRYSVVDMYLTDFGYNPGTKQIYQQHFKGTVIKSIEKSINNRINGKKHYKYELNDWQKKLMKNYLEQLLGEATETITDPKEEPEWLKNI